MSNELTGLKPYPLGNCSNLDLEIVQYDNKFVVTHDGQSVAWFRWESDAKIFVEAITGKPSVPFPDEP